VFFRQSFVFPKLRLGDAEAKYSTFVSHGGRLTIVLRALPDDDSKAQRAIKPSAIAIATLEDTPKPSIATILAAITHNRFPKTDEEFTATFAAHHERPPWDELKTTVLRECMPVAFQNYTQRIEDSVADGVMRFHGLLRWRCALDGPEPLGTDGWPMEWSTDGEAWHFMPFTVGEFVSRVRDTLVFNQEGHDALQCLVNTPDLDLDEPVYRELHREAVELQETSPRSSLVLAVAAAEIAIKTICDELGDGSTSLLEGKNAPPAVTLYRDNLAKLPVLNTVRGSAVAPPEHVLKSLEKAVSARNNLVHRGSKPLDQSSLNGKLNDIRDLLLLVDYYRGFAWAFDQMTETTRDEMTGVIAENEAQANEASSRPPV
jgi:hypothetical protein